MILRECIKCHTKKKLNLFDRSKNAKYGRYSICKKCRKPFSKKYYNKNRKKIIDKAKKWALHNREHVLAYKRKHTKLRYQKKKEFLLWQTKQYRLTHKKQNNAYLRKRRKKDINFRLKELLRGRLYKAIKGLVKGGSAVKDLGCSIHYLKKYLEKQFKPGMNWKNHGKKWEIDHIRPLGSFDLSNRKHILVVCNYKNLRPLWIYENRNKIKQDKIAIKRSKTK